MKVGIIGHRSWIAQHLAEKILLEFGYPYPILKNDAAELDMSTYDCVFLFSGRARPTDAERRAELDLLRGIASMPRERFPKRLIYIGSMSVLEPADRRTEYGLHKSACEDILIGSPNDENRILIIRAPAVFGRGQSEFSPMLIPQLGVRGSMLELRDPDRPATFIHVDELVKALMVSIGYELGAGDGTMGDLLGYDPSFTISPRQLKALRTTWQWYDD